MVVLLAGILKEEPEADYPDNTCAVIRMMTYNVENDGTPAPGALSAGYTDINHVREIIIICSVV